MKYSFRQYQSTRDAIILERTEEAQEPNKQAFGAPKEQTKQQISPTQFVIYPNFQGADTPTNLIGQKTTIPTKDALGNEPGKDYNYFVTEKKGYVEKMIKDAQGERWKTFNPISVIEHPILQGKYLAIDGNHRLGAFKIGQIPEINATIVGHENILLATPDTKWHEGIVAKTIPLQDAMKDKSVDLGIYFTIKELNVPQQVRPASPQQPAPTTESSQVVDANDDGVVDREDLSSSGDTRKELSDLKADLLDVPSPSSDPKGFSGRMREIANGVFDMLKRKRKNMREEFIFKDLFDKIYDISKANAEKPESQDAAREGVRSILKDVEHYLGRFRKGYFTGNYSYR